MYAVGHGPGIQPKWENDSSNGCSRNAETASSSPWRLDWHRRSKDLGPRMPAPGSHLARVDSVLAGLPDDRQQRPIRPLASLRERRPLAAAAQPGNSQSQRSYPRVPRPVPVAVTMRTKRVLPLTQPGTRQLGDHFAQGRVVLATAVDLFLLFATTRGPRRRFLPQGAGGFTTTPAPHSRILETLMYVHACFRDNRSMNLRETCRKCVRRP